MRISPSVQQLVNKYHLDLTQIKDNSVARIEQAEHLLVRTDSMESKVDALVRLCQVLHSVRVVVFCSGAIQKELHKRLQTHLSTLKVHRRNIVEFFHGDVSMLITTDVLARGVHFAGTRVIINLGLPPDPMTYVHRVARGSGFHRQKHTTVLNLLDTQNALKVFFPCHAIPEVGLVTPPPSVQAMPRVMMGTAAEGGGGDLLPVIHVRCSCRGIIQGWDATPICWCLPGLEVWCQTVTVLYRDRWNGNWHGAVRASA